MQKMKIQTVENFGAKSSQKKALLVTNGGIKDFMAISNTLKNDYAYSDTDFVIAADGGAANCINLKIVPDVIIGDMDSIAANVVARLNSGKKDLKFINCSHDKDESDTQLALDYLKSRGFKKILVIGALGNRFDHSFANIVLLASDSYADMDIRIITENSEIFVARSTLRIRGAQGKRLSIFSLTPYTFFEKTSGLKYRLKNEKLFFSPVRGLSNIFTKDTARLDFKDGTLLITREL